ncbi:MAG: hypothetical protein A3A80_04065 [Candidatus Terrybacteria bacterium RIFCSPLOWO2_01_FULL_44_24]|uniref:Type II secretion system protein n=1 Tax=Candidatus Terrybacteria bacterium RIFCSPHIGHO2_01_FULL_43_35 TaxID=1802361 RepID=A0A1G2PIF2_9BACT|nr:MAG: hypothetical protein A2828_02990 [Candidatus Terrybacteria bacterium RIFCSPHIGHO2_01_FULL_43_35]OHA50185.1 MAG: hypothetical protein A3B75_01650 [Candidatus Terrybacteria bacterium RIFCSPHIGHO2_02_FULL_43_14]OHA51244.1 MAG: hypothetical protein A3A80_04065 [Candidatus Terrybacteria bacterium RIFCSPLOWO2_01_FULL_44_24]
MVFKNNKNLLSGSEGFSVMETVVAIFIFSMVILVASGTLMSVIRNQRSALKDQELMDSMRGAREIISKAVRVGYDYTVPDSPLNTNITFNHPAKLGLADCPGTPPCPVRYYLQDTNDMGTIYEQNCPDGCPGVVGCDLVVGTPGCSIPITSEQIDVTKLQFITVGYGVADQVQSRVMMYMEASSADGTKTIATQTMLSQRALDL